MKEMKDDTNRWRDIPCSWTGRINIMKMMTLPKAIYRFHVNPIKLTMAFSTELQNILQFVWKHERPWITKVILRKKKKKELEQSGPWLRTTKLEQSKQYGTGTKTEYRSTEQVENPEINPYTYGYLIYDKGGKLDSKCKRMNTIDKNTQNGLKT